MAEDAMKETLMRSCRWWANEACDLAQVLDRAGMWPEVARRLRELSAQAKDIMVTVISIDQLTVPP